MILTSIENTTINIIYYDKLKNTCTYKFNLSTNLTINDIFKIFKIYLDSIKITLNNCFGNDIGSIISHYLPCCLTNDDILNNEIYSHIYFKKIISYLNPNIPNKEYYIKKKIIIPKNYNLNNLKNKLEIYKDDNLEKIVLRIRINNKYNNIIFNNKHNIIKLSQNDW